MFKFFEAIWRRRNLVLGVVMLCVLIGVSLAELQKNVYVASAVLAPESVLPEFLDDLNAIDTAPIMQAITEELDLLSLPEFNDEKLADNTVLTALDQNINLKLSPVRGDNDLHNRAIAHLQKSFRISVNPHARFSEIRFQSLSPDTARAIAGRILEAYKERLANKYDFIRPGDDDAVSSGKPRVIISGVKLSGIPSRPPMLPVVIAGLLMGLLIGSACAMSADYVYRKRLWAQ